MDGATGVSVEADLDWADAAHAESYDVHFGTSPHPPFANLTPSSAWPLSRLNYGTTYYWRIVAKNGAGVAPGPVWSFTTEPEPLHLPDAPSSPNPANGEVGVSVGANLDWADAARATSYDVHFGAANPPPLAGSATMSNWELGTLDYGTAYYWKLVAKNAAGETTGPVWSFVTEARPNQPPIAHDQLLVVAFGAPTSLTLAASDPDHGPLPLTYTVDSQPSHGALTGEAPQLTYAPSGAYVGFDSFVFKAYDGAAYSDSATVTLMVTSVYRIHGLDFSPYVDGQDPTYGSYVSEEQLRTRMRIIAPYTQWIRTFGCTHGLELAGAIARELNLNTAIGAWLGPDPVANQQEIANVITVAAAGQADIVIVGSEVLLRHDLTPAQLIAFTSSVRAQVPPGTLVTTADAYGELLNHPEVLAAVDCVFVNYYPYWEGIRVDVAMAALHAWHQQVVAAAGGKPVIVSETGWPSCGNTVGEAVPSSENAGYYFLNFVSWARANDVSYFYFEALDESWKAAYEGPQGACWGVWDKNGIMKPDMQRVFDGDTVPDNWTVPGGPGAPEIVFTYVPQYGSFDDLAGRVWHVAPADHRVAVYIYVAGGWWNKPTWADPLTPIAVDGRWTCDITTGGTDQYATHIVAYLLPAGYAPPLLDGDPSLPPELDENAADKVEVTRSP